MSTRDIDAILHCSCDAIENCMNQIHSNVCHQADKQEKQADELIEAHLEKKQETHRLEFREYDGSRGLA